MGRERLDGGNWTRGDIKFSTTRPPLPVAAVALSERWNSRYNVSRQVIIRISNREIAIYSWCAARREEEKRRTKMVRERKGEKQGRLAGRQNHLATSNPLRTKLPSYHRASCQDARRQYTNANECGSVSGLTMPSLLLSFSRSRRGRANFVIVGTEDSRAQPKTFSRLKFEGGCFWC